MLQFTTRRLLLLIPVLLGVLLVTLIISRLVPGDPCIAMMGEKATQAQCAAFRERFGLNDNIGVQFVRYLGNLVQGDFGESIEYNRPVVEYISERLPMTFELTFGAMLFSTVFGVLLGVISALRRNTIVDTLTMIGANIGISMPVFWLGLMLAYVFALLLKGTPFFIPPSGRLTPGLSYDPLSTVWHLQNLTGLPRLVINFLSNSVIINSLLTGNFSTLRDAFWHLLLPSLAVGTIPLATVARMTRSSLLDVLGQDYIRTARAKGLSERSVILKHAMRNALTPVITLGALELGTLLSGAVLTEQIFSIPGFGKLIVDAVFNRDYAVVQGVVLVTATIYITLNLIADIAYILVNPRLRA